LAVETVEGREAILRAALECFSRKGFRGVSLEEVAGAAGVSKGLIFYHFRSKEDLFCLLVKELRDRLAGRMEAALERRETAREKLVAVVSAYLGLSENERRLWRLVLHEVATLGGGLREILAECRQANLSRISRIIEEGKARGELREVDVRLASLALLGMVSETVLGAAVPEGEAGSVAEHITEIFLHGIAAPES